MNSTLFYLADLLNTGSGSDSTKVNIPTLKAEDVIQNGLNIAYAVMVIVAVIVIILGGILYSTSAGNPAGITKAKNQILYAVVGIVVVIIAFAVTNFVMATFK